MVLPLYRIGRILAVRPVETCRWLICVCDAQKERVRTELAPRQPGILDVIFEVRIPNASSICPKSMYWNLHPNRPLVTQRCREPSAPCCVSSIS